ncbi:MAG TPA: chromate efflux transporter [Myxococcaceae bacterium]|nr:chromate efflux transporter [Myxococcaceae bacterium]
MSSVLGSTAEWLRRATARSTTRERPSRRDLFTTAFWLGCVGFGGGISVLSQIDGEVVKKRGWLTPREFSNTVTVSQMLPGGAAANALAYIGMRFGGWAGGLAGYVGFVLPGVLAVGVLSWVYVRFGTLPSADRLLAGFNAAVVGIICAITLKMVRTGVSQLWQMGVAAGALLLSAVGSASPAEVVLLAICAGLAVDLGARPALARARGIVGRRVPVALPEDGSLLDSPQREDPPPPEPGPQAPKETPTTLHLPVLVGTLGVLAALVHATGLDAKLIEMAVVYFRTGLGAYGGGFAIIPHLRQMVHAHEWITDRQFADAVAIGKITPGPVLLMATFIGYLQHGWLGASVATVSIFAGPFALVGLLGTWLDRVRSRRWVRAALRGLTPAVVGLMAAAAITLGGSFDAKVEVGIAAATALTMVRFEVNPAWLLVLGGAARLGLSFAGL